MTEEELLDLIQRTLESLGSARNEGERFAEPELDVLAYFARPVRLAWVPVLGRATSVVAVVHRPPEPRLEQRGSTILRRVARAAHGRYPPWPHGHGLVLGLTTIELTSDPIQPDEEKILETELARSISSRHRVVPFGLFRINLAQEVMIQALRGSTENVFPEGLLLAESFAERFQRYLELWSGDEALG